MGRAPLLRRKEGKSSKAEEDISQQVEILGEQKKVYTKKKLHKRTHTKTQVTRSDLKANFIVEFLCRLIIHIHMDKQLLHPC